MRLRLPPGRKGEPGKKPGKKILAGARYDILIAVSMTNILLYLRRFAVRVTLAMIISMLFVVSLSNLLVYQFSLNAQFNEIRNKLMLTAQTAVLLIDPDVLAMIPLTREGVNTSQYYLISQKLKQIKRVNPQIKYIYTMVKTNQDGIWKFVVDADPEDTRKVREEQTAYPGDLYNAARFPEMLKAFEGPSADRKLEVDEWGVTLSGYAPIRDSAGKAVAMLGVDAAADNIYALQKEVQKRTAIVFLIASALSLILGMLIASRISRPLEKLVEGTRSIAQGNLTYRVAIEGRDEIGELAQAFNGMSKSLDESRKKLIGYFYDVVQTLVRILEVRDHYTKGHSESVAEYAGKIAERLGHSKETVELLKKMALLHDIGKLGVKDSILHKPGKLTEEEWVIIRKHPLIGEEILKPVLTNEAMLALVRQHHERYDGQGYPDKLSRDKISIFAAIVAVADAYDAMTTDRSYRKALSKEVAIEELKKNRGTQFHPKVVDIFLQILAEADIDIPST